MCTKEGAMDNVLLGVKSVARYAVTSIQSSSITLLTVTSIQSSSIKVMLDWYARSLPEIPRRRPQGSLFQHKMSTIYADSRHDRAATYHYAKKPQNSDQAVPHNTPAQRSWSTTAPSTANVPPFSATHPDPFPPPSSALSAPASYSAPPLLPAGAFLLLPSRRAAHG